MLPISVLVSGQILMMFGVSTLPTPKENFVPLLLIFIILSAGHPLLSGLLFMLKNKVQGCEASSLHRLTQQLLLGNDEFHELNKRAFLGDGVVGEFKNRKK
jgi:hypothetical protein